MRDRCKWELVVCSERAASDETNETTRGGEPFWGIGASAGAQRWATRATSTAATGGLAGPSDRTSRSATGSLGRPMAIGWPRLDAWRLLGWAFLGWGPQGCGADLLILLLYCVIEKKVRFVVALCMGTSHWACSALLIYSSIGSV